MAVGVGDGVLVGVNVEVGVTVGDAVSDTVVVWVSVGVFAGVFVPLSICEFFESEPMSKYTEKIAREPKITTAPTINKANKLYPRPSLGNCLVFILFYYKYTMVILRLYCFCSAALAQYVY